MKKLPVAIHGIHLQTQPTPVTCVQTCLAMALGVPVADVIARYGGAPLNQQKLCAALTECGVRFDVMMFGTILFEGWHFATVPSLNFNGGAHQVLFHWGEKGLHVVDPSASKRYAFDGSDVKSWSDLTPFHLGGKLPS